MTDPQSKCRVFVASAHWAFRRAAATLVIGSALMFNSTWPAGAQEAGRAGTALWEPFEASAFVTPTQITNPWLPMKPGMRWVYRGTTVTDDGRAASHRLEVIVTGLTKTIDGITTVVLYEEDQTGGKLTEAEISFFAQDTAGNVWLFGEYPEEYEDGKLTAAPGWIHGRQGARAGVMMRTDPRPGTLSYSEGWAPDVGWTDRGIVHQTGVTVRVPAGDYGDVLVIREAAREEPDAKQLKYYARGIGNIRVGWIGDKKRATEAMDLVLTEQLSATQLTRVEAKALALDRRAYKIKAKAFAGTEPVRAAGSRSERTTYSNQVGSPTGRVVSGIYPPW
jgi:hypothetical protein